VKFTTCKNCKGEFTEEQVSAKECNVHDGTYNGEEWTCCNKVGQRSDGCQTASHDCEKHVDWGNTDWFKEGMSNNAFSNLDWCINCHNRFRDIAH